MKYWYKIPIEKKTVAQEFDKSQYSLLQIKTTFWQISPSNTTY
jgi:hypothetical protein